MTLLRDIRSLHVNGSETVQLNQELMKRIRNTLVNSPRDDEEVDFLLHQFSSRQDPASIDPQHLKHLADFLRGEHE